MQVRLATGELLEADVVVATADLPYVYDQLLPEEPARRKLKKMRYSSSTISFFWAFDKGNACRGNGISRLCSTAVCWMV